jgi:large subunit ribosomal protein L29
MKGSELHELPTDELASRLDETKEELFNLRFQHATGQLENYGLLGQAKRDVARIRSVQRARELGIASEPSPEEAAASRRRRVEAEEAEEARRPRRRLRRGRASGEDGDAEEDVAVTDELEAEDLPEDDEPGAEPEVVPLVEADADDEGDGDEETEE